jgi:hypothetical protein
MKNRSRWDRLLIWISAVIALVLVALMMFAPEIIARVY